MLCRTCKFWPAIDCLYPKFHTPPHAAASPNLAKTKLLTKQPPNLDGFDRTSKNADDIVITLAIRTPLAKGRKGGFKDTSLEYLVYAILKEARERANIDPALVEDICLGNVRCPVCDFAFA